MLLISAIIQDEFINISLRCNRLLSNMFRTYFDELYRVIMALQTADESGIATPADWRPGDDVIISLAGSCGAAKGRMEDNELDCKDWFFCTKKLDKDTVLNKVLKKK